MVYWNDFRECGRAFTNLDSRKRIQHRRFNGQIVPRWNRTALENTFVDCRERTAEENFLASTHAQNLRTLAQSLFKRRGTGSAACSAVARNQPIHTTSITPAEGQFFAIL